MARQIGTVLGVASLVAILASVLPSDPVPAFRSAAVLVFSFFIAAGVVSAGLLSGRVAPADALSPTPVEVDG